MADWLDTISTHWFWLSLGLILGVAEMVAPGFFLMWLGLAAIIVGLLDYALPIAIPFQVAHVRDPVGADRLCRQEIPA